MILPEMLDDMDLNLCSPTAEDISQTLAPYMQNYFRRDPRFPDRLKLSSSFFDDSISITVGVIYAQTTASAQEPPWVSITTLDNLPHIHTQLFVNLVALVPQERVVQLDAQLDAQLDVELPEKLFLTMPNIEVLRLSDVALSEGFLQPNPDGPRPNTKLLPSLKELCLQDVTLNDGDWSHLTTYLAHQASDGRTISFGVFGHIPYMCPELVNEIKGLVKQFNFHEDSGEESE